jgi:carbonic anhydrase
MNYDCYTIEKYIFILIAIVTISTAPLIVENLFASNNSNISAGNISNGTPKRPNILPNVRTDFNQNISSPSIADSAFVHSFAVIIGDCFIGKNVLVAPMAVCRADEGVPIHVGDFSNIQDGVILHAVDTTKNGTNIDNKRFSQSGDRLLANNSEFKSGYAIFIKGNVSLAHDSLIHGPVWIGNNTIIGMKSIVFDSKIGNNVAIRLGSIVVGVEIPDNKLVPIGSIITNQSQVDLLPSANKSQNLNMADLINSKELATAYRESER